MTRLLLKALNIPGILLITAIGIAMQTSLFAGYPLNYIQPDIVLLMVIWFALKREFGEGGVLTLVVANIAESHSSSPQGLMLITYMLVYLLVRAANVILVIPNLPSWVMLTLGASILWKGLTLFVLYLLGVAGNEWRHTLIYLFPGAVVEGAAAIWIYRWLDRFDWVTFKSPRAEQLMEDELRLEGEGL